MEKFAKLFEDEKYGQIVVLLDTDDEGDPCVRFMTQPSGLGVCAAGISFHEHDDAQATFDKVGVAEASAAAADMWKFSPLAGAA